MMKLGLLKLENNSKYLYKYQVANCRNIRNLICANAVCSSRTTFNDIFDSKIILNPPSYKEFISIEGKFKGKNLQKFRKLKDNGGFSKQGKEMLRQTEIIINKVIDSYAIYSLSNNAESHSMWAHYADNHSGFCIKFKKEMFEAKEIQYKKKLPSINMLELIEMNIKNDLDIKTKNYTVHNEIHEKLHHKLEDWDKEQEYRYIDTDNLKNGKTRKVKKYKKNNVDGIIFGYRMSERTKNFLFSKTNFKNYYQVEVDNGIVNWNVPYN